MTTRRPHPFTAFFGLGLAVLVMAASGPVRAQLDELDIGPARPEMDLDGLAEFDDRQPAKVDAKTSEMEIKELLQPGSKDAADVRDFKRKNAIHQILYGAHEKKGKDYYFDARCQAAKDLGEFADEQAIRDLLFEKAVSLYWVENPKFIPTAIASFMKAGTNEFPRLYHHLAQGRDWKIRGRMASILQQYRALDPEGVDRAVQDRMVNDYSEDVRGPLAIGLFGKYGAGPMPEPLEALARSRLRDEANTLVKYVLLWNRYYKMDLQNKNTGNLGLYRDLLFSGKTWENRWMGLEAIRLGRLQRDPSAFPEYERDALPDVIKVLRQDPNPRARFAAVDTLYPFTNAAAVLALAEAMEKDADADVRAYAGRILGVKLNAVNKYPWMARYPAAAKAFLDRKTAEAPEAAVRGQAAAAFGRALADPDPFVRYYAVMGLGKLNSPEALRLLKAFQADPEDWINEEAAKWIRTCEQPDDTLLLGSSVGF